MNTHSKLMVMTLALVLALAATVQADGPSVDDRLLAEAAERAELDEITALLTDPDSRERFSAVHALVNLASRYAVLPVVISDLLNQAAIDSDLEIARFASNALYQLRERARRLKEQAPELRTDPELRELAVQRQLEEIGMILNDPRSLERYNAAHALFNLASSFDLLPGEALDLLHRMRDDDDFEIARLAEIMLAKKEGRPIDPAFVQAPAARVDIPAAQETINDPFDQLSDPDPNLRYDAVTYLLEAAPKDGRNIDPEVLKAFNEATSDPNPRVRSFAEFAVAGGLAGDENALRQVHVGTVSLTTGPGVTRQEVQPRSSEGASGAAVESVGALDEHGVFVGVTKAPSVEGRQPPLEHGVLIGVTRAEPTEGQQPPVHAEVRQHDGGLDEHGVFVGVVVPPTGAERQPQTMTVESTSGDLSD